MIFNSLGFFVFLTIVLAIFYAVPIRFRGAVLFLASNVFVGLASVESLVILYAITLSSFFAGKYVVLKNKIKNKTLFYSALLFVVGFLIVYKYTPLIVGFSNYLSNFALGDGYKINIPSLLLPLGLSFYTFQAIGYLVSVYRGQIKPEHKMLDFLIFMFFFPKLLAGPIERANSFLPQIKESFSFNEHKFNSGVKLFILGLFKKIVIADRIGMYVDVVYAGYEQFESVTLIFTSFLYVIQIYADFSGYTDMARGLALMFGFNLLKNFERPILSQNITHFWRKWHMSLTTWATDYIYYPIVIKYRDWNNYGVFVATLFTFLLIGVWHGSSVNFIIFGLLQVMLIFFDFIIKKRKNRLRKKIQKPLYQFFYRFTSWLINFTVIMFSMMIFRITDFQQFITIITKIVQFKTEFYMGTQAYFIYSLIGVLSIFIIDLWEEFFPKTFLMQGSKHLVVRQIPYALFIILILLIGVFDGGQFIYVQY